MGKYAKNEVLIDCPVCGADVFVRANSTIATHRGSDGDECAGSRTAVSVDSLDPGLTDAPEEIAYRSAPKLSQHCALDIHDNCPRETTLGTAACECACHYAVAAYTEKLVEPKSRGLA